MACMTNGKKPLRTIVADDSPFSRTLLQGLLEKWGFEVHLAANGLEAWEMLQAEDVPTLALLDWMMPGLEGVEICQRARQLSRKYYPYILLVTSKNTSQNAIDALEAGADDYVSKPFDADDLKARLLVGQRILSFQEQLTQTQERLARSEEKYRNLIENSPALICTHDLEGTMLSINPTAATALGYTVEECIGKNMSEVLVPEARAGLGPYLQQISKDQFATGNMAVLGKQGQRLIWSYTNRLLQDGDVKPYVLGHAQDITEKIAMQRALDESQRAALEQEKRLSRIDPLTGLANRRAFYEGAEVERARSVRYVRNLSMAYIDLDNFKHVNDQFGHEMGDQLLVVVANILRSGLRQSDMAARLGGDEFAVILPETDHLGACRATSKLHELLTQAMQDNDWPVTFSMGVVTFESLPATTEEMIQKADELMYTVKHSGKNRIATSIFQATASPAMGLIPNYQADPAIS